jgi:hypothetical protein
VHSIRRGRRTRYLIPRVLKNIKEKNWIYLQNGDGENKEFTQKVARGALASTTSAHNIRIRSLVCLGILGNAYDPKDKDVNYTWPQRDVCICLHTFCTVRNSSYAANPYTYISAMSICLIIGHPLRLANPAKSSQRICVIC